METFDFDRKRDFGAIIEDSFKVGIQYLAPMLKYLLIFVAPLVIINALVIGAWLKQYTSALEELMPVIMSGGGSDIDTIMSIYGNLISWRPFVSMVIGIFTSSIAFLTVLGFYNHVRENNTIPEMQDMQKAIFSNLGRVIGQYLVLGLFIMLGFLAISLVIGIVASLGLNILTVLLSIAGVLFFIYAIFKLMLAAIFLVTENQGIIESIRSSWSYTTGHWWKLFGGLIIVAMALGIGVSIVALALTSILSIAGMNPLSTSYLTASTVITNLFNLLTYPFIYAVPILLYYSLRPGRAKGAAEDMIDQIGSDEFFGDNA
jgi:hypothetical protein